MKNSKLLYPIEKKKSFYSSYLLYNEINNLKKIFDVKNILEAADDLIMRLNLWIISESILLTWIC